ncbi:MAG: bifunctional oligoribonuclease/PAP phosphatase NrnA [Ligilactobacillus ruminis]
MTIEEKIINKIKEFDKIIIHRHQNADPDALGSQGGLAEVIKAAFPKKSVKVVGEDVKGLKWILTEDEVSDDEYADALVIVTDTANTPRIDDERYDKGKCLIKIDHHPNDDAYGDILFVRPEASSCSEIIVDLVNASDGELILTKEAARRLYAGIIGDTGRFMYDCTTPHTMRVTAQLLEQGIDAALVNRKMDEINEAEAKLSAYVYQNLQITKHHAAYVIIKNTVLAELGAEDSGTAHVVSLPGRIEGIACWTIFVEQEDGTYRLRIRSKKPVINELAKEYGGGGHPLASGARLEDASGILEFVEKLDDVAAKYTEEK